MYGAGWLVVTIELRGIVRIGRAERALLARDARIDLAVGRAHREVVHRALRHAWLHRHLRRRIVRRPDDEVAVRVGRRNGAVRQLLRRDVARRVRIASGRRRARARAGCGAERGRRLLRRGGVCAVGAMAPAMTAIDDREASHLVLYTVAPADIALCFYFESFL